jgi:type II secretory pathway component PulF
MTTMPLAYTVPPKPRVHWSASILAAFGGGMLLLPLGLIPLLSQKYNEIFRDFGVALPQLTRWFLVLGTWLMTPVGLVVLFSTGVVIIGISALAARRWLAAVIWCLLSFAVTVITVALFVVSMYVPMVHMIEGLQGGGAV